MAILLPGILGRHLHLVIYFVIESLLISFKDTSYAATGDPLDRSHLVVTFNEEFNKPATFYDPLTQLGTWKTNYFFGDQKNYSSRTLDGDWEIFSDPAYNGVNPFKQSNGLMAIIVGATANPSSPRNHGKRYTTGMLTTEKSFTQTYGYFEIKTTLPAGPGLWPAFWMMSTRQGSYEEFDIMENHGRDPKTVYCSVHRRHIDPPTNVTDTIPIDTVTRPHTYGLLWTARELVWYIDDKEVTRHPNPGINDSMYLLVTIGVGGAWGGYPDATTPIPAQMLVEHVSGYALAP